MALLDDIMTHLQAEGVATEGTDLFAGALLDDQPDAVTVVYETAGIPDEDTMGGDGSPAVRHAGVQVRTRGAAWEYEEARLRAEAARAALVKIANESIGGTTYLRVRQSSGPVPLGRDQADRWEFTVNLTVDWLP